LEAQGGLRRCTWRPQSLQDANLEANRRPKALREANLEAKSPPKTPNWRSKALPRLKNGAPKPFQVVKNHRKTYVFLYFFKVFQSMRKLRWNMLCNWLRRPKSPSWTPTWRPKSTQGPHFGGPERSEDPNLEIQSAPKTPTWRSRALPRTEIGGPERSKNSTWGPKRRKELYLELQSPSESPIWRAKALRDPNLEAQRASKMQTKAFAEPNLPMIRATRSRSIDR